MSDDEPAAATTDEAGPPTGEGAAPAKLTKAERLEARAARLREAEERRAEQRRIAAEAPGAASPGVHTGWVVTVSLLSVLSAGLIAVLVVGFLSWQHQRDVNSARASALSAAKSFAVDFGSYDYRHLTAEFREVESRLTPEFRKSFSQSSAGLVPTIVKYKGSVKATVQGAGVTSAGTTKATVVVFLDQTVTTTQSSVPRLDRNRLQVYLVRSGGKWLVSKLLVV